MKTITTLLVLLLSAQAHSASKQYYCKTDKIQGMKTCKNVTLNRRNELGRQVSGGNPVAVAIDNNKNLFVYYTAGDTPKLVKCQVAGNVKAFKMSANPGDVATTYFESADRDLYDVRMQGAVGKGKCPKAAKVNMLKDSKIGGKLQKYSLIPNSNSKYVGMALTTNDDVLLWTDKNYRVEQNEGTSGFKYLYNKYK